MKMHRCAGLWIGAGLIGVSALCCRAESPAAGAGDPKPAPIRYVWGKAYYILPETTSDESGYFSLCEGTNGNLYIGTAKYGVNSYLVEFNPVTEQQRIVIDTHKVCGGLTDSGFAAQAKIHTRNYVTPSGKVYVGSKQGYPRGTNDTAKYPGGYVMVYDPALGATKCLGMPYPGLGVIDVSADERRRLLYVTTCEDEHWMRASLDDLVYRAMGPMLFDYATTLIDNTGRAHAITADFNLATYDPDADTVKVRTLKTADGQSLLIKGSAGIPNWILAPDGRTAYLIRLGEATLFEIDLQSEGDSVTAKGCGTLVAGENPDSRGALTYAPDGRVYAIVKVNNKTGFGTGSLHVLSRFDPKTRKIEELGVLAVKNPGFFDFEKAKASGKQWIHGYHTLPDGTLTPLHAHMALVAAHDGTLYATILYPFTLLRIDAFRTGGPNVTR